MKIITRNIIFSLMLALISVPVWAAAIVKDIQLGYQNDLTKVVINLSNPAKHNILKLDRPERLVIDLKNSSPVSGFAKPPMSSSKLIRNIRFARRNKKDFRIVLDLSEPVSSRSALLKPNQRYGYRLVLDLKPKSNRQASAKKANSPKKTSQAELKSSLSSPAVTRESVTSNIAKRDIVIAIDPGHGGRDPGAIGPKKIQEKKIVMQISRLLSGYLQAEQGFKPVLVRDGDYFVPLRKRTHFAREHHADLLVSIHADAFKIPSASGASVYALSERGASSETARWLAQHENQADLIGGAGDVSLDDKDPILKSVLLDLSMTASLSASLDVGKSVLSELKQVAKLHQKRVEQAAFVVLKSPDIPSILVETGFISNPGEAKRLQTKAYQRKIARAIFNGIRKHFASNPPPGTLLASKARQQNHKGLMMSYVIRRGDTLSSIAARNNVSERQLKKINKLPNDRIRVGQVLQIPTT